MSRPVEEGASKFWGYTSICRNCTRSIERLPGTMWVHHDTGLYECEPWRAAYPTSKIDEVWT